MNKYFGELPTSLPRTPEVENLHLQKIALLFATGETRAAKLEVMPLPDSPNVAMSAKLTWLGENPRDGLIQYLTREGIERIQPDERANAVGATLALDLVG